MNEKEKIEGIDSQRIADIEMIAIDLKSKLRLNYIY
jgi:hypothetical protein